MTQINLSYMLACLYMGATEEYDRSLTDERSRYDPTEAFPAYYNYMKSYSNRYAIRLRHKIMEEYGACIWKDIQNEIRKHSNYSAQNWVNEYRRMWR